MVLRPPDLLKNTLKDPLKAAFDYEAAQEAAASLGHAGRKAEKQVEQFNALSASDPLREKVLSETAEAVYGYFIQRELCGMRKHDAIIREMKIPPAVLARLGAKQA